MISFVSCRIRPSLLATSLAVCRQCSILVPDFLRSSKMYAIHFIIMLLHFILSFFSLPPSLLPFFFSLPPSLPPSLFLPLFLPPSLFLFLPPSLSLSLSFLLTLPLVCTLFSRRSVSPNVHFSSNGKRHVCSGNFPLFCGDRFSHSEVALACWKCRNSLF